MEAHVLLYKYKQMFGLSPGELIIVLIILVLLFGAKRLPELGASLGEAIQNFRKSFRDSGAIDVTKESKEAEKKPSIEEKDSSS
jgi:sec-independent protein translocase protein TatA